MANLHAGIREIEIRDFRGIDELKLSFVGPGDYPTQIVVLGGPNGSGKTSVLEACLLAGGHEKLLRGKWGSQAVRLGAADYHIEATIQVPNDTQPIPIACDSRKPGRNIVPFVYYSSWRAPNLPGAIGITAGKRGKRPAKTEENRLWIIKQYFVNARAHELFPSSEQPSESRYSAAISDLNRAWKMFYPEQFFSVEPTSDDPDSGFDLLLQSPGRPKLSADLLSSGQIELLTFAGGLVVDKSPQGIMVIDEPELHLDPQWHRQVLKALQFLKPDWQIVVATHSPEVFDSVRSFERHFLLAPDDPRTPFWLKSQRTEVGP